MHLSNSSRSSRNGSSDSQEVVERVRSPPSSYPSGLPRRPFTPSDCQPIPLAEIKEFPEVDYFPALSQSGYYPKSEGSAITSPTKSKPSSLTSEGSRKKVRSFSRSSLMPRLNRAPLVDPAKNNEMQELQRILSHTKQSDISTVLNDCDKNGFTALHWAARLGHLEIARALLQRNADTERYTKTQRRTALYLAAQYNHVDLVNLLLRNDALPNAAGKMDGATALHKASQQGHEDVIKLLIMHGAKVNLQDLEGMTPLFWAMQGKQLEAARILVKNGSNPEARIHLGANLELSVSEGLNVLHKAAGSGATSFARIFLEAGANPDAPGPHGMRALHRASARGDVAMLALLIEFNVDVNAKSREGWSGLHFAARFGHRTACRMLLRFGAVLQEKNDDGQTPRDVARKHGHPDVI